MNPEQDQVGIPLAKRYKVWETANRRKVAALGVMYAFKSRSKSVLVQPVASMVQEDWVSLTMVLVVDVAAR